MKSCLALGFLILESLIVSTPAPASTAAVAAASASEDNSSWWKNSLVYEIFVRSFSDSNGDGVGDLRGIESRLDYLQGTLGVDALWLTPIFASPSYHGYDTTDYRAINPDFGDLGAFQSLLAQAHARGLHIILDLAVNHTSNQHPWFISAANAEGADTHNYYVWSPGNPGWPGPQSWFAGPPDGSNANGSYYYAKFGASMPNLNWRNPQVLSEVEDIMRFWAGQGVDGFRLDAARYYVPGPHGEDDTPETHQQIQAFTHSLKAQYPGLLFIGEIWADTPIIAPYVNTGTELDLAFDFPTSGGLRSALQSRDAKGLTDSLQASLTQIPDRSRLAPFLTNHDMDRPPTGLAANQAPAQLKLASAVALSLPGTPFMYYGDELGLNNGSESGDLAKRTPMPWTEDEPGHGFTDGNHPWQPFSGGITGQSVLAQSSNAGSLLNTYRGLIALRKQEPALRTGSLQLLNGSQLAGDSRLAGWVLRQGPSELLVVANFGDQGSAALSISLSRAPGEALAASSAGERLWGSSPIQSSPTGNGDQISFPNGLGPFEASIVRVR